MDFNITSYNSTQSANKVVNLARVCATYSVSNANTVDTDLVDSLVNGQKVDEVGPEGILGGESDLDA